MDGTVVTDVSTANEDLAANPSNYYIYDCEEGVCKQTQGYLKKGNNIYKFIETNVGEATSETVAKEDDCIINSNIGELVTDGGVCYDEQKKVLFKEGDDMELILEETAAVAGTPFAGVSGAVPIVHDDSYVVVDKYVKVLLYNRMDGSVVTDIYAVNEDLAANPSNYFIYDCESGVCRQSQGYLVNGGKVIGFIGNKGGIDVTSTLLTSFNTGSSCSSSHLGKLLSGKGEICSGSGKSTKLDKAVKRLLLNNGNMENGTPFDDAMYSFPIKTGDKYVVRDKFIADSVYLVTKDGVMTPSGNFDDIDNLETVLSNYVIVECVSGKCKRTTGYVKSKGSYYAFGSNGGSSVSSISVAACASNSDSGKIRSNGDVCIEGDRYISMNSTPAKGMILKSTAAPGTPFVDDTYYVFVKNGEDYVIKDTFRTSGKI